MDPLVDAAPSEVSRAKRKRPASDAAATLHGALALALALDEEAVPPQYRQLVSPAQLVGGWRASVAVFARYVPKLAVRFSSDAPRPAEGDVAWVYGTADGGPVALALPDEARVRHLSRSSLRERVLETTRALAPLRTYHPCEALLGAMLDRAAAARSAAAALVRRPRTGLSAWYESARVNGGAAQFGGTHVPGLAPLCVAAPRTTGARAQPPPGEGLPHLDAFRLAAAMPDHAPLRSLGAHGDALDLGGGLALSHSDRKVTLVGPDGGAEEWAIDAGGTPKLRVLEVLRSLDDRGLVTLDPFLRRVVDMPPDLDSHAAAVDAALALLPYLPPHARFWEAASAHAGVDLRLCWAGAFGAAGWPAFVAGAPLDVQRFGPKAMLRRSPSISSGLLVYPALGDDSQAVQRSRPAQGHVILVGDLEVRAFLW
jgi:hypothetical protein